MTFDSVYLGIAAGIFAAASIVPQLAAVVRQKRNTADFDLESQSNIKDAD